MPRWPLALLTFAALTPRASAAPPVSRTRLVLSHVDRVLIRRQIPPPVDQNQKDYTEDFGALQAEYRFQPDGLLGYFGLNSANLERLSEQSVPGAPTWHGKPMVTTPDLKDLFAKVQQQLALVTHLTVNIGIEPMQAGGPKATRYVRAFQFVKSHPALVQAFARTLAAQQQLAKDQHKQLDIIVRYASEMNEGSDDNVWAPTPGHVPDQQKCFLRSFPKVRALFQQEAPEVLFSFSPTLHATANEIDSDSQKTVKRIQGYWPGKENVDIVGCTWYVRGAKALAPSRKLLSTYIAAMKVKGKPFAIDEMGATETESGSDVYSGNDLFLKPMVEYVQNMQVQGTGINWKYITLFLDRYKYGVDARLPFIAGNIKPA